MGFIPERLMMMMMMMMMMMNWLVTQWSMIPPDRAARKPKLKSRDRVLNNAVCMREGLRGDLAAPLAGYGALGVMLQLRCFSAPPPPRLCGPLP